MFVRRLCSQTLSPPCSIWVQHNADCPHMHNVAANLRRWAEAIGEKLRLAELKDKEMHVRLQQSNSNRDDPILLPEEPVLPDEHASSDTSNIGLSISYALKMAACNLLLEITRFLRDIPPHFAPGAPVSQVGTPLFSRNLSMDRASDRRGSNASAISSDAESTSHQTHHTLSTEFKMPSLNRGQFGSSLSVEDAEPPEFINNIPNDEFSNTSPRKKRASFYLHINSSSSTKSTGGSLSRNTSLRRQNRMVRVTETPTEARTLSRAVHPTSLTPRNRRKSISSGVQQQQQQQQRPRRFSIFTATTQSGNSGISTSAYHPARMRRKSVGGFLVTQHSVNEHDYFPPLPTTPSTPYSHLPHPFFGAKTPGGGGGVSSLGNTLNISSTFNKLKRTAQRAFRRHGTKAAKSISETSPNSSPGPLQRKKSHMQGAADTYSQKSVFYPSLSEESWRYYPWLDMIEHLVLVDTREAINRNKQSCLQLTTALKKVYSYKSQEDQEDENMEHGKNRKETPRQGIRKQSSFGSVFVHRSTLPDVLEPVDDRKMSTYNRGLSLPATQNKIHQQMGMQTPRSISVPGQSEGGATLKSNPLGKVNFANLNSSKFVNSFLARKDDAEETIQLTIEAESPFEKSYLAAQSNKERQKYVDFEFSGLMHVPFSTLVHAAPILHSRTFSTLKGVAWDTLLSTDQELSQVAAAFFLLACAKESEKAIKTFVANKVSNRGGMEQNSAIMRFKVLWDSRYGVWPRMEERAQKKLNLNDKEDRKEVSGIMWHAKR